MATFATFAEHFENIEKLVHVHLLKVSAAQHCRVNSLDLEEMSHSIYDHMLRNRVVERFDPEMDTKISTYLYSQIYWLAMNEITDYIHLHSHEIPVGDHHIVDSAHPKHPDDVFTDPYITQALQYCLEQLRTQYPSQKSRDFAWLLGSLVEQVERTGESNLAELAEQKSITRQALSLQLKALQKLPPVQQLLHVIKGDRYRAYEPLAMRVNPNWA